MKKVIFKFCLFILVLVMFMSLFSGCTSSEPETQNAEPVVGETDETDTEDPISTGETPPAKLTYWEGLGRASNVHESLATHPGWIELQKRTNVEIEFWTPSVGNEAEQFNLMIVSKELPDMISWGWLNAPGGPSSYLKDGIIIPLNDHLEKSAPDLLKYYNEHPEIKRQVILDDGTQYIFPCIYSNSSLAYFMGPMVRKDILEKVDGLDMTNFPESMETIDDWERVLTILKKSGLKGDSGRDIIPLSLKLANFKDSHFIVGAWGITMSFSHDNGIVQYGPTNPKYKEFLTLMNKWYNEGLLDSEFAGNTDAMIDEKVLDNRVATTVHSMGGGVTRYTSLAREDNPNFLLNMTKYPVKTKGETPIASFRTFDFTGGGVAITTACKDIEAAVRLLNYDYSEEGYILANFGIEGETFNWVDDYPTYTDIIMNNPDGLSRDIATGSFVRVGNNVGIKSGEFLEQRDSLPEQLGPNGRQLWMETLNDILIPPVTPTPEESGEFASIMGEINTYVDEMTVGFIMGDVPLDEFDNFVDELKQMNIETAIKLRQQQLDRYFERP